MAGGGTSAGTGGSRDEEEAVPGAGREPANEEPGPEDPGPGRGPGWAVL